MVSTFPIRGARYEEANTAALATRRAWGSLAPAPIMHPAHHLALLLHVLFVRPSILCEKIGRRAHIVLTVGLSANENHTFRSLQINIIIYLIDARAQKYMFTDMVQQNS
eukprot:2565946-Pleurochrysis_carterae.AAC.3